MKSCQPIRRVKDEKKEKACLRDIAVEGTWFESGLFILVFE